MRATKRRNEKLLANSRQCFALFRCARRPQSGRKKEREEEREKEKNRPLPGDPLCMKTGRKMSFSRIPLIKTWYEGTKARHTRFHH